MKKYIFIFMMISYGISDVPNDLFLQGNQLMLKEKYVDAVQSYESIIALGYENADIYYNLGNAYYRMHHIGQAIWAYQNALYLNPRNKDFIHNLSLANARRVDRIELPPPARILKIYRTIKSYLTLSEWFLFGSIILFTQAFWLLCMQFAVLRGRSVAMILNVLIVLTLITHIIALDKYLQEKRTNTAVIIGNGVDAYSGPFYGNKTILFRINEGSIADVSKTQKDWTEIILIDGKKGWVPNESIRILR